MLAVAALCFFTSGIITGVLIERYRREQTPHPTTPQETS